MGALYNCQSNYICLENFINFCLSCGILYYFMQKGKIIYTGNKGVLVLIDQILCLIAMLQMSFQVLYFLFADSNLWLISLRCFGLIIEVLICVILMSIVLSKEKHDLLFWIGRLCLGVVGLLWLYEGIIHYKESVYNCKEISNLFLSFFGLILSIAAFSIGFESVHELHRYKEYLLDNKNDAYAHQLLQLETRVLQIRILKISGLLQFCIQFVWDCLAYFLTSTTLECTSFYQPRTIETVFIYASSKMVSLNTLPIAVFLVFYECNKEYFNVDHHIWNHQRSHRHLHYQEEQQSQQIIELQEIK